MFLRLHIRANSDSKEDQALKLKVRDAVLKFTSTLLKDVGNKEDAMKKISENLDSITDAAEEVIKANGFAYVVKTALKKEYFEKREYESFYLPADIYDSLILEIGTGEGHNWWCVIFPAVCTSGSVKSDNIEADDSLAVINTELIPDKYRLDLAEEPVPEKVEVKYEFWIVNFIKSIINFFDK
jgi:stage II sporulation protein R